MQFFPAIIREGNLTFAPHVLLKFREWAGEHEGTRLTVRPLKKGRSLSQNAYYFMYLTIIADETGDNADDLHEFFKRKLLPPRFVTVRGEEIKLPASTTELSSGEFGEYLDKICALTNVPLPNPADAGYISNYV
jgi:hypothetical protein